MQSSQELNKLGIFYKVTPQQRLTAAAIFVAAIGAWWLLWLVGRDVFDIGLVFAPCGLKQRYGITCPTCGMTTSAIAFAKGDILRSFYIQPAGGLLYVITSISAFLALFVAVFGVNFRFFRLLMGRVKIRYIIITGLAVIAVGWAVTLIRELTAKG